MDTTIRKGSSAKTVISKIQEHTKTVKKKNIKKYCGIISLKKDPVNLQKQWRDEWE